MEIDKNVINARIAKLRKYLKILNESKEERKEDFIKNYKIYGIAERYLQLSIECVLDIGNHLISRLDLTKPNTYQEVFQILGKNNIIPEEFARKISRMAGFRNILIHQYLNIDREIVHKQVHDNLGDFQEFIKYIIHYMKDFE